MSRVLHLLLRDIEEERVLHLLPRDIEEENRFCVLDGPAVDDLPMSMINRMGASELAS